MANVTRVRVEALRMSNHASYEERQRNLEGLLKAWKRASNECGISHEFRKHEFYEKATDIRRRKRKQAGLERLHKNRE